MEIKVEDRNLLLGILVAGLLAWALSYTMIWQLVIIAGLAGGILNSSFRRGSLSGTIGLGLSWLGMMIYDLVASNTYILLEQFGGLLGLDGMGYIIFIVILLIGIIFGALGGAIGGSLRMLISEIVAEKKNPNQTE
jgi:fluoride ion exporter CrcB/FEX